jgi:hypothetical protein
MASRTSIGEVHLLRLPLLPDSKICRHNTFIIVPSLVWLSMQSVSIRFRGLYTGLDNSADNEIDVTYEVHTSN